ncbi:GPS-CTERM domain-containing protein, partial [Streptomyces sp. E2N166]|uniref:GPS-CTERM domain-containing protein n=1 Tax=Streptomyces sp. E2N166 TaxID=1851909 RepID=UPI00237B07B4
RYNTNALLCGIAGYPESGCGEQVAQKETDDSTAPSAAPDQKDTSDDDGPSVGLYAGIAIVAALAGAATWQARRRGNATD